MEYNLCYNGDTRSSAYRFTVLSKDDESLLKLKHNIKQHNKSVRCWHRKYNKNLTSKNGPNILRVTLMARGPRRSDEYYTYDCVSKFPDVDESLRKYYLGKRKPLHSNCDSTLQHKYATHFDVYVHTDTSAQSKLIRELETGLTSYEQKLIDDYKYKILLLEIEGRKRVA